jgi:hypothetical protein
MPGVKVTVDRIDAIVRSINSLTKQQVVVGIPEENANRDPKDGDAINNAALLYIHEFGAPAANIPARPTLGPGIAAYRERAIVRLKAAAQAAMDDATRGSAGAPRDVDQVRPIINRGSGNDKPAREVTAQLNAIGLEAVVSVKKQFTDGQLAPLKPATIAARKRAGFDGEKPLIRTADLMRHINYAIRKTK